MIGEDLRTRRLTQHHLGIYDEYMEKDMHLNKDTLLLGFFCGDEGHARLYILGIDDDIETIERFLDETRVNVCNHAHVEVHATWNQIAAKFPTREMVSCSLYIACAPLKFYAQLTTWYTELLDSRPDVPDQARRFYSEDDLTMDQILSTI